MREVIRLFESGRETNERLEMNVVLLGEEKFFFLV